MCEMVDSPDADLVSRVLETCLRAQWSEVAREGSAIVLRGLGPTHRINRNDRAVFAVKPAEGGKTAIEADVTYLASALVGDSAPQNELVQRKLDGVLELVRMDIDLAQRRAAHEATKELKLKLVNSTYAPVADGTSGLAPAPTEDLAPAPEEQSSQGEASAAETAPPVADAPATEPSSAASVVTEPEAKDKPAATPTGDESAASVAAPENELRLVHRIEDAHSGNRTEDRLSALFEPEPARERSMGKIFAALLVIFVVAAAGQEGWLHRAQLQQRAVALRADWQGQPAAANVTPAATQKQPDPPVVAQTPAVDAQSAAEAAKLAEPDPKKWLANWADSLNGQDAGVQAAFYADPVEKYFLRKNVSRADVLTARQAAIAGRKGPRTVALDDVIVAQQTDTTARILMVMHIVTEGSKGKVDERLPTQVRLKRIDGQWRIVSEQVLG